MKIQYHSPFPWCPFLVFDNSHTKLGREDTTEAEPRLILDSGLDLFFFSIVILYLLYPL